MSNHRFFCIYTKYIMAILTEEATEYPISVEDMKAHLKVEHSAEDTLIESYIASATEEIESKTGLELAERTYTQTLSHFTYPIHLDKLPVKTIDEITYYDADNVLQTLDESNYALVSYGYNYAYIEPRPIQYFPPTNSNRTDAVQITYTTGCDIVPQRALQAIRFLTGLYHKTRTGEVVGTISKQLEQGIDRIIAGLRRY